MKHRAENQLNRILQIVFIFILCPYFTAPCWASSAPSVAMSIPAWSTFTVKQSSNTSQQFNFTSVNSFKGNVSLSVSGLPSGVTASWSDGSLSLESGKASSTLKLAIASSVKSWSWYKIAVNASGDGVSASNTYELWVVPGSAVQTAVSTATVMIERPGAGTLVVTAQPFNGVKVPGGAAGVSAKIVSGLPNGVTASWSKPAVTSSGAVTWTLTLTAGNAAWTGTYPVGLRAQITDSASGAVYAAQSNFTLLVDLVANIKVGSTPGRAVAPSFMGLGLTFGVQYLLADAAGADPIFVQLLRNLTSMGSGPINIRVAGDDPQGRLEPTSSTVSAFAKMASATGAKFDLGIDFISDNVALSVDQARNYAANMPAGTLEAIEIGNEPDLYAGQGFRPAPYSVQDYEVEFKRWSDDIVPLLPKGVKLMGPSWAIPQMSPNIPGLESEFMNDLSIVSIHNYATGTTDNPPVDFLLTPAAAAQAPAMVSSAVATTHGHGLPFRIGETNSVAGGGIYGISDAFSSALWSLDTMFEYANVGVDGVNWSGFGGAIYSPFAISEKYANGTNYYKLDSVNALYYGMLAFQSATQYGAKLLPVVINAQANVKAWAVHNENNVERLVIINKDEKASGVLAISIAGHTKAKVLRLLAPSYRSTNGITFAGQTFDGSTDGKIKGDLTETEIDLNGNGLFYMPMPETSAAIVVFE